WHQCQSGDAQGRLMARRGCILAALVALALLGVGGSFLGGWYGSGPLEKDTAFVVLEGATLASVAEKLDKEGAIGSADGFRLRARIFAGSAPVKAGEFLLPRGASPAKILSILQSDEVIRRFVTIPEGMPSIMVHERLMAQPHLTGDIP